MLRDLISLIFPQNCINCSRSLFYHEQFICTKCKLDLPCTNDHLHEYNELMQKFAFEPKILSASAYLYFIKGGMSQRILHELKYKGKQRLGELLGEWYAKSLRKINAEVIVPIPLHKSKERKRGFNQSLCFAKGLSRGLDIPIEEKLIKRIVNTTSQTKKSKFQRWSNMENAYSEAKEIVAGKHVLIVDDVITTGATIGMLSERLIDAGCLGIHIAAIARG